VISEAIAITASTALRGIDLCLLLTVEGDLAADPGLADGRLADLLAGDGGEVGVDDREVSVVARVDGTDGGFEAVHPGTA
jgi:hypothetical protein